MKKSAEFVSWYSYNEKFVCGLYSEPSGGFTSVLSDMEDLTFTTIEALKAWIDNKMREEK